MKRALAFGYRCELMCSKCFKICVEINAFGKFFNKRTVWLRSCAVEFSKVIYNCTPKVHTRSWTPGMSRTWLCSDNFAMIFVLWRIRGYRRMEQINQILLTCTSTSKAKIMKWSNLKTWSKKVWSRRANTELNLYVIRQVDAWTDTKEI